MSPESRRRGTARSTRSKTEVEARWREDEIASRLKAKAADILDKLKAATPFDALAKTDGPDARDRRQAQARQVASGTLSPKLSIAVFHTAKDGFGSAEGERAGRNGSCSV